MLVKLSSRWNFWSRSTRLTSSGSGRCSFLLLIIVLLLWLVNSPLLLGLDGNFERSVVVSLSVVSDENGVPEVVHSDGRQNNIRIVQLVVVANPRSNESPESLHCWVSSESGSFLWLSRWLHINHKNKNHLPSTGLFQRFLGASLAVKGV